MSDRHIRTIALIVPFMVVAMTAQQAFGDEPAIPRASTQRFLDRVPEAAGSKLGKPQIESGRPGEFQLRAPPPQAKGGASSVVVVPAPAASSSSSHPLVGGGTLERRDITPYKVTSPWQ